MTDEQKINIMKTFIKRSDVDFDIDSFRKVKKNSSEKYFENMMGSDSFFFFSARKYSEDELYKKEICIIVDEKYVIMQFTTFKTVTDFRGKQVKKRIDEIARYKYIKNKIMYESASVSQESKPLPYGLPGKEFVEIHSIEEMFKADEKFDSTKVKYESFNAPQNFKFTNGFSNEMLLNGQKNNRKVDNNNLIGKYILFNEKDIVAI